jgi:recombination associated protein RdgC
MQLRKIVFLEGTEGAQDGKKEDNFDADAAIATGELGEMVPALLEALGGEAAFTAAVAEPAEPAAGAAAVASATTEADAEDSPF